MAARTFCTSFYLTRGALISLALLLVAALPLVAQDELDLPIAPPVLKLPPKAQPKGLPPGWVPTQPPAPPPEEGDDPRDTPPPTLYGEDLDVESGAIVYVLDLSCSMLLQEPNPFQVRGGRVRRGTRRDRALAEFGRSVMALADSMRFNVVRYGTGAAGFRSELVPATLDNKVAARKWAETGCLGMTATGPAMVFALGMDTGSVHFVLLTDGAPNWDGDSVRPWPWHRLLIRNNNAHQAPIDVFGLHPLPVCRAFCRGVAADSGGTYFEID